MHVRVKGVQSSQRTSEGLNETAVQCIIAAHWRSHPLQGGQEGKMHIRDSDPALPLLPWQHALSLAPATTA